jgi:hypothetical protein
MPSIKLALFWLGAGLLLSLGLYYRLLGDGIPATHDGPIHVVRMVSYYTALQQGQLPPRWGPNLANGLGYPVLNFNYPLANIIAVVFLRLHLSYTLVYQLISLIALCLGVVGICVLLYSFSQPWWVQFIAASAYIANPFTVSHIFVRGGIGETLFLGLMPWVLFFIRRLIRTPAFYWTLLLGLFGGILLLSHNVLVVFCIPFLGLFTCWQLWGRWNTVKRLFLPLLLAFLLSAFFWIPALAEKGLILVDDSSFLAQYSEHFLTWTELLTGSFGYGYSRPGPVDGFMFSVSEVEFVSLLLCLSWSFASIRKRYRYCLGILGLGFILWLTTYSSLSLWRLIPLGPYIQFPWRLLWFFHLGYALFIGYWLKQLKGRISKGLIGFLVLLSLWQALSSASPQYRVNRSNEEWLRAGETTNTLNENSPKTFSMGTAYQVMGTMFGDQYVWASTSSAQIAITHWDGTKRHYSVTTPVTTTIVERTAFFAGWETRANGQLLPLSGNDPWFAGLITYSIPAGSYTVDTQFTQHTPARMVGNILTLMGIGLFFGLGALEGYRYVHKK